MRIQSNTIVKSLMLLLALHAMQARSVFAQEAKNSFQQEVSKTVPVKKEGVIGGVIFDNIVNGSIIFTTETLRALNSSGGLLFGVGLAGSIPSFIKADNHGILATDFSLGESSQLRHSRLSRRWGRATIASITVMAAGFALLAKDFYDAEYNAPISQSKTTPVMPYSSDAATSSSATDEAR